MKLALTTTNIDNIYDTSISADLETGIQSQTCYAEKIHCFPFRVTDRNFDRVTLAFDLID